MEKTDSYARYKEYSYKLKCTYIDEGTVIGTATVSIDAKVIHLGVLLRPKTVDIYYGDNAADIFERAIEKSGFSYTNSGTVDKGFYLETISRPGILRGWMIDDKLKDEIIEDGLQFNIDPSTGEYIYDMDSLGQLDFCQGSGWAYSVNDEFKEYGTRVLPISRETKTINAYGYQRGDLRGMPEFCITIGMKQILASRKVYIALNREWQNGIAKHVLYDEPQAAIPASLLQLLQNVRFCTCKSIAAGLF